MKVLFLDAYHFPEIIAFTHLEEDLIKGFVEAGHEIDVICPIPTRGVNLSTVNEYKKKRFEETYNGNVKIRRFWAPQEGKNPLLRAFRYCWCNFMTLHIGKKYKNIDVIFANSTPPTQGLIAGILKKTLKCRFVYSLQDLFPDSLITTGLAKKGSLIYKIGTQIAHITYQRADKIIVISKSFQNNLLTNGVSEEKIELIYNWVDTSLVKPIIKSENSLFDELNISRDIPTVVYAGNFGASQNGQIIVEVAKLLENENLQFVLFGGGSEYVDIRRQANSLSNVFCFDLMPLNRVSEVYSMGDIVLITNAPGVGDCGMPSKLWSIMATNRAIVASIDTDSELAEIILRHANGMVVPAGDVKALATAIKDSFTNNPIKYSSFPREYAKRVGDRVSAVTMYLGCLERKNDESFDGGTFRVERKV